MKHQIISIVICVPLLIGCGQNGANGNGNSIFSRQTIGTVIGGVGGGVVCNKLIGGVATTAICGAVGAWAGNQIGKMLDEKEKVILADTTYKTFETGKAQTVKTEKGTTITTEVKTPPVRQARTTTPSRTTSPQRTTPAARPGATPPPLPSPSPSASTVTTASQEECGVVTQTIVTNDNQRFKDDVRACKEDGVWVIS